MKVRNLLWVTGVIVLFIIMSILWDHWSLRNYSGGHQRSLHWLQEAKNIARKANFDRLATLHRACELYRRQIEDWYSQEDKEGSTLSPGRERFNWYSEEYSFRACVPPKVASSTWRNHVVALSKFNASTQEFEDSSLTELQQENKHLTFNQFLAKHVMPDKPDHLVSDPVFMSRSLNFIFVRNPFSRISSLFIENLGSMRVSLKDDPVAVLEKMLDLFDSNDTKSHSKSMVNFQHAICRPCRTAQLDMIVKLESFQQDFGRLAKLLNITSIVDVDLRMNIVPIAYSHDKERIFYGQLPKSLIRRIYERYEVDFALYGYEDTLDTFLGYGL